MCGDYNVSRFPIQEDSRVLRRVRRAVPAEYYIRHCHVGGVHPQTPTCACSKVEPAAQVSRFSCPGHTVVGMIALLSALCSLLLFRVRSRAALELELVAMRHQMTVLRRQRPGRPQLFSADRLLWVWLYRI